MAHIYGLTTTQVKEKISEYGPNQIFQAKKSLILRILTWLVSPISLMLFTAALLSLILGKDFDFYFILALITINLLITIWQEAKADNAIQKLNQNLNTTSLVLRDNIWQSVQSTVLVPDDYLELNIGDIVPADSKIINATNLTINQSVITGESFPVAKKAGENIFSGSYITTGKANALITATGSRTYFGRTLSLVDKNKKRSSLEIDILRIAKYLSILSFCSVLILSTVLLLENAPLLEIITLDLSLLIAGIPVSLPTIMTLIIALGVVALSKKNIIVRRLSSLEDLANVNFLLTDKTGTLTKNKITVQQIISYPPFTQTDVIKFAAWVSKNNSSNIIDKAILEKASQFNLDSENYNIIQYIPADSTNKHSSLSLQLPTSPIHIVLGAPQIITPFCQIDLSIQSKISADVLSLARKGQRTLSVAINKKSENETNMQLVGIIALSDELREDSTDVINFLQNNGIDIAMVTGDNHAIAAEIAGKLKIPGGSIITKDQLEQIGWNNISSDTFHHTSAFAEIQPIDKYKLVQKAKKYYTVAVNGDGVNDIPAVKEANVGFAVKDAVAALKSSADIVLLSDGIITIKDAIIESRKIFSRIYSYSMYRISESLRLIITITILGIINGEYPLTALQIIILALLNDIPIISLAFDRVKLTSRPAVINVHQRFIQSTLYGMVGVVNSLILFFICKKVLNLPWEYIQTIFFLKLTVSGHLLIYVTHTNQKWFQFLPGKEVIIATTATQILATFLAATGLFMPSTLPFKYVVLIWIWAFIWMQVSEAVKRYRL